MSADFVHAVANWFLLGSLVVGVVSTYAIVVSGNIRDITLRRELAQANKASAEATERTEELRKQNLELQSRVEQERLARIELEERVAWRRLTKDQQSLIGSRLIRFSGQLVTTWYNVSDHEGNVFASDIAAALKLAKWDVFAPASVAKFSVSGRRSSSAIETGVIVASTGDKASLDASDALVRELLALGFDANKSPRTEARSTPTVFVNVEVRPQGAQGQAKIKKQQK